MVFEVRALAFTPIFRAPALRAPVAVAVRCWAAGAFVCVAFAVDAVDRVADFVVLAVFFVVVLVVADLVVAVRFAGAVEVFFVAVFVGAVFVGVVFVGAVFVGAVFFSAVFLAAFFVADPGGVDGEWSVDPDVPVLRVAPVVLGAAAGADFAA